MEEDWWDALLYLCGNLAELEAVFQMPPISLSSDEGIRLTEAVFSCAVMRAMEASFTGCGGR